jgi:hypothetical protein
MNSGTATVPWFFMKSATQMMIFVTSGSSAFSDVRMPTSCGSTNHANPSVMIAVSVSTMPG